jgi:hypothetical protein
MKESKAGKTYGNRQEMWTTQTANVTSLESEEIIDALHKWLCLKEGKCLVMVSE